MLRAETLIRTIPEPEEGGAWLLVGQKMPQSLQELISVAKPEFLSLQRLRRSF
jgi:hypothetical protein